MLKALCIGAIGLLAVAGAVAEEIDHARQYEACMALADREPDDAFDAALAWRDMGGGDAADHCMAKALLFLGQHAEAAQRFEDLAQHIKAEPEFKAALFGHAAQGWMLDGNPERAEDVLTAALELSPNNVGLLVDRGLARAETHRYQAAEDDFSAAIEIDGRRAEAFAFRAAARRYLDKLDDSLADAEQALLIDPDNAAAVLERGMIRRLSGDDDGARQDWLLVIDMAPGTQTASTAQVNLQIMDSGDAAGSEPTGQSGQPAQQNTP
jgi:tetratricopeptide (TPR) repeat protein